MPQKKPMRSFLIWRIKKLMTWRPGTVAFCKIHKHQEATVLLIRNSPFAHLIWEISLNQVSDVPSCHVSHCHTVGGSRSLSCRHLWVCLSVPSTENISGWYHRTSTMHITSMEILTRRQPACNAPWLPLVSFQDRQMLNCEIYFKAMC